MKFQPPFHQKDDKMITDYLGELTPSYKTLSLKKRKKEITSTNQHL